MDFDAYWKRLVDRVYKEKEELTGPDAVFYRLTSIRGETMVGGMESYFERRHEEFEADMQLLEELGFSDLAKDFRDARTVMFGNKALSREEMEEIHMQFLEEDPSLEAAQNQINAIYRRVIEKIDALDDYRMDYGVKNGLFVAAGES